MMNTYTQFRNFPLHLISECSNEILQMNVSNVRFFNSNVKLQSSQNTRSGNVSEFCETRAPAGRRRVSLCEL